MKRQLRPGLDIREVGSPAAARDFIAVPRFIYAADPHWIEPLRLLERRRISLNKNPYFEHAEGCFWVAYDHGKPIGRIGATINRLHLAKYADATGHFALLEAIDERPVFSALLEVAEDWLRARGMSRIAGPFNLSTNEEVGMLVDGFGAPPMVMMGHARPYYARHMAALGYLKEKDVFAYRRTLDDTPLDRRMPQFREIAAGAGVTFRSATRASLARDTAALLALYNDAWAGNWGALPMTHLELAASEKNMKPIVDPRGFSIAERNGAIIAVLIALPNLNEAIAGLGGRLFPFGWARMLWRLRVRGVRTARIPIAGLARKLHGTPLAAAVLPVLLDRLRETGRHLGLDHFEASWVLEDNRALIRFAEAAEFDRYKTYRVFAKPL